MFKTIHECRLDLVAFTETGTEMNMDYMPCSAARVSFGNEDKTGNDKAADQKLMHFLASHQHMTPFEYQHATFLIEVPLFIRSQIHRHRAFSYNEISRRYTSEDLEFWIADKFRGQHKSSKQASSDEVIEKISCLRFDNEKRHDPFAAFKTVTEDSLNLYESMVESGVAREQARAVLPQSLLTKFYMGGNLRSWAHFIELRRDEHAQFEVRVVADRIAAKLSELWPESCKALGISGQ